MPIYTPPGALTLDKLTEVPQRRIAVQGFGGTGKTFSALTFPNPIVMNFDRGLGAHYGRADVIDVPFYNEAFCKTVLPSYNPSKGMMTEVILKWMYTYAMRLGPEQTLIVDSNSQIQNAYHRWYEANKMQFMTDKGKVDGFVEYRQKIVFYTEFLELLKAVPCHVFFIAHETEASTGKHSGKIRPLLSGQLGDELMSYFSDYFRQQAADKPDVDKMDDASLLNWGMTKAEMKVVCASFPRKTIYFWQTEGDNNFDGKCSSLVNYPRFLPANFQSFEKYRRKLISA